MILALSFIVPILFVASLVARQAPPGPNEEIPLAFESTASGFVQESEQAFAAQPAITYQVLKDPATDALALNLSSEEPLRWPEALVFWTPERMDNADALPEDRVLLGTWAATSARTYALPQRAQGNSGSIVLYSLSQQDVLASGTLN